MVTFPFDARSVSPNLTSGYPGPKQFARFMWSGLGEEYQIYDLETACDLAAYGGLHYAALNEWAIENRDELSDVALVMIAKALLRKPPSKGKGKHMHRDYKLRKITYCLRNEYGRTLNESVTILKEAVVPELQERTIFDIVESTRKY